MSLYDHPERAALPPLPPPASRRRREKAARSGTLTRAFLFLVLACAPGLLERARAAPLGQPLDAVMVAEVTAAALAFMAPRTLDAVPISQLTVWGLRGFTTLDSRLAADLHDGSLRLVGQSQVLAAIPAPPENDAAAWGEATAQLTRAAWNVSEPVRRAGTGGIIRTFFDELFNHLDPYSRYVGPDEAEAERMRRAGRAGIGITLRAAGGGFVVAEMLADSPAADGGVRIGDRVLEIDGESTEDADLGAVNALIAGPEDSDVVLMLRGRDGRVRSVDLTRRAVPPETVFPSRLGDMLILRVTGFSRDTGTRLAHELERGLAGPHRPRGVVLDLRGNRGGVLTQAVSAAAALLPRGVIALTAGRDPAALHIFTADTPEEEPTPQRDLANGLPVVVAVDGRSASAAEILAAALVDQGRAVAVGSATMGKGLVQTIGQLPDGGELFITWSRVLAPWGWPIQALGVLPQLCTSLGQDPMNHAMDALKAGEQPLARALARHQAARAPVTPAEILEIRSACPAAEGHDADLVAAKFLIDTPAAYAAALLPAPPDMVRSAGTTP